MPDRHNSTSLKPWPADNVERRSVADLVPYARNPRTHSDRQVDQIAASIREWGWTIPILVKPDNTVIAGHGRLLAAKKLGITEVPCMVADGWTDAQLRAYVIADNQLALQAGWDAEILSLELGELDSLGFDIGLTGFDEIPLMPGSGGLTDPDDIPDAPVEPVSRPGDVWLLGRHRLVCGDCTEQADVDEAMQGRKADLCLTDPPYGLGEKKASGKNDYSKYCDTLENLVVLADKWLPIARSVSDVVVFSSGVTRQWLYPAPEWVICWFYGGGQLRSPWGFNCWQPFLCYGNDPSLRKGRGARPDAVDLNVPANAGEIGHPCPKPVRLWDWFLARLIFNSNSVLYEPFSGSGTTLIAAESRGCSVAAIEIDPRYIDVSINRWQEFTGDSATLEGDGCTFAEIAAQREIA